MSYDQSYGIVPLKHLKGGVHVLLIQHSKALYWGFPKGHPENGESAKEAAERELFEETGLHVLRYIREEQFETRYKFMWNKELIHNRAYISPLLSRAKEIFKQKRSRGIFGSS